MKDQFLLFLWREKTWKIEFIFQRSNKLESYFSSWINTFWHNGFFPLPACTGVSDTWNHGPHVACQMHLCGPRAPQKNDKSIKFEKIWFSLMAFLVNCGPQKLISYVLWYAEHFFSRMWPMDQFEFETPGLADMARITFQF